MANVQEELANLRAEIAKLEAERKNLETSKQLKLQKLQLQLGNIPRSFSEKHPVLASVGKYLFTNAKQIAQRKALELAIQRAHEIGNYKLEAALIKRRMEIGSKRAKKLKLVYV